MTIYWMNMKKTRRHFTRGFKLSVIAEVEAGKSITQVARDHGIHPSMLFRWRIEFNENPEAAFRGNGKRQTENAWTQRKVSSQIHPDKRKGKRNTTDILRTIQHDLSNDPNLSICKACRLHGLSRSAYYKLKNRPETAHPETEADIDLKNQILEITQRFPEYGYRRVTREVKDRGYLVNHKRVLRIMQEGRREAHASISPVSR